MGGQHRRRRLAALTTVGVLAAAVGLLPAPVVAAECPAASPSCVVVTYVSTDDGVTTRQATRTFTADELRALSTDAQLNERVYNIRRKAASQGGKLDTRPFARGRRVSVQQLLAAVQPTPPAEPTFVETPNASGVPSVLSSAEVADPASNDYPFYRGLPPVVYVTGDGTIGYIRPLRDRKEDTNGTDYFTATGALELTVHTTGRLIEPTVVSSGGTDLDLDDRTTFSVSYPDDVDADDVLTTRWDFGDGSRKGSTRPSPSKSYGKRGTYDVAVAVRTSDGSYGRSDPLEVKVAKPPEAPSSGAGGGDGGGLSGGGLPPPYDPFDGELDPPGEIDDLPLEEPAPEPTELAPVDDGLVPVEGYVLAGSTAGSSGAPEAIPGTRSSSAPAPATQASTRQRVATWTIATLAALLLLAVGAAGETRWFHQLRHPRPHDPAPAKPRRAA